MAVYFVCMFLSCICSYIDTRKPTRTAKMRFVSWITILIPSFMAAFRSIGIGTDTNNYGSIAFRVAVRCPSLKDYLTSSDPYVNGVEIGYRILVYAISCISDNIAVEFFVIEFIISFFTYKALLNNSLKSKTWMGVMLYYTLFIGFSLNLMRQSIAIALILWGTKFIFEKKLKKYVVVVVIASSIQLTSVITLALYPLFIIFGESERENCKAFFMVIKKLRFFLFIMMIMCVLLILNNAEKLMMYVISLGIKSSYAAQLGFKETAGFNESSFILMSLFIIPYLTKLKILIKTNKKFLYYFSTIILAICLWQLSIVSQEAYRIGLYFWALVIIMIPKYINNFRAENRVIYTVCYCILANFYFVYYSVVIGANNIYPYATSLF